MKSKSMELNIGLSYRLALLGGVLLSLSALNAQGQTVIRRSAYSRQTTFANGQTMTIYSPYATYPELCLSELRRESLRQRIQQHPTAAAAAGSNNGMFLAEQTGEPGTPVDVERAFERHGLGGVDENSTTASTAPQNSRLRRRRPHHRHRS